jgi:primosomal protein N' (replication factor Y)
MEFRHVRADAAESQALAMASKLAGWIESGDRRETTIIGPVPCFFSRLNGLYRWQIVLRGPNPVSLLRGKNLGGWRVEVDPSSLL